MMMSSRCLARALWLRGVCGALFAAVLAMQAGCERAEADKPGPGGPAAAAAAGAGAAVAAQPNQADPRWILQRTPHSKKAIVFVHGLFGDTVGTWTHANGTRFFDLIASSSVGAEFDVYAFGYTSKMLGSGSLNIVEATGKLNEYMKFHGVLDYDSITFVAHSMGGLVVLRRLIDEPSLRQKVRLVALYATPQEGAQIARIGDQVARNPALAQLLPSDANGYLQQLDADWKRIPAAERPFVACGYETKPLAGVSIVPYQSATRFCSQQALAIEDADHLAVVKPDRPAHPSVVLLVNALRDQVLTPVAGARRLDMKVSFKPWRTTGKVEPPPALELIVEEPELQGPYGFRATPIAGGLQYQHQKFLLPQAGQRLYGYVHRVLYTAHVVNGKTDAPPIKTRLCLKVTDAPLPADGAAVLDCAEGDGCYPREERAVLAACGARTAALSPARWHEWLPLAPAAAAQASDEPAVGDWIVPRLETLQSERQSAHGQGFSEVRMAIDGWGAEGADAVTAEARINGRRLWVNALPSWALARAWLKGEPVVAHFGIENLNATGKFQGREQLDVRILLLKDKRVIAEDSVSVDFVALRDIDAATVTSKGGREVRWSAAYHPGAMDRYQVLAYGDSLQRTVLAKEKFDSANARSGGAGGLPLVGVVRPPISTNPAWGVSIGQLQPNGQVRFSFSREDAAALCKGVMAPAAKSRLAHSGFPDPGRFNVREIKFEKNDDRPKPLIACASFSAA